MMKLIHLEVSPFTVLEGAVNATRGEKAILKILMVQSLYPALSHVNCNNDKIHRIIILAQVQWE